MNGETLRAARLLLHFMQSEAAEHIGGVTERSWHHWETGNRKVPADVERRAIDLLHWRSQALVAASKQIADMRAMLPDDKKNEPIGLVWYSTVSDWCSLPGRDPALFRPQQSVIAALIEHGCTLVPFDRDLYFSWLGKRKDNESMRAEWAANQAPINHS